MKPEVEQILKVEQEMKPEVEQIFMDDLNRMIIQYNSASNLPARKRLISALTNNDISANPRRRSRSSVGSEAYELLPRESNGIHIVNVCDDTTEEPIIDILGECAECEYQSTGGDFWRKRNPCDSSVKDATSGTDFLLSGLAKKNAQQGKARRTNHDDNGGLSAVVERARSAMPTAYEALGNIKDVKGTRRDPIRKYGNERSKSCAKFCSDSRSTDERVAQAEAKKRTR